MKTRNWIPVAVVCLLGAACADPASVPTPPAQEPAHAPAVAEIVCRKDGTTRLMSPEVRAQSDGVHVVVTSNLDEPASLNGLGMDVDPGVSEWTLSQPPGTVGVACWPFSDHSLDEPPTQHLTILDPDGIFVDGEVQCPGDTAMSWTADYATAPDEDSQIPLEEARTLIRGCSPRTM